MKPNASHLVLLYGALGLLLPAAPALAMSTECESLISPRSNESADQMSARMAALQKCFDAEVSERAQAIPVLKSTGKCPADLSYLDARLPSYPGDAEYSKIRAMALRENMVEDLAKARNMGLTVAQAAEDALVQVKIAEAMEGSMADLARAYNNTDAATLAQLKNGTYAYRGGTLPLAYQGYLAAYVGAVVNREAAAAIACIARHEQQSGSASAGTQSAGATSPGTGSGVAGQVANSSQPTALAKPGAREPVRPGSAPPQPPLLGQNNLGRQAGQASTGSGAVAGGAGSAIGSPPQRIGQAQVPAPNGTVQLTPGSSGPGSARSLLGCWNVEAVTRYFEDGTRNEIAAPQCSWEYFSDRYDTACLSGDKVKRTVHGYSMTSAGKYDSTPLSFGSNDDLTPIAKSIGVTQRHAFRIESGRMTRLEYWVRRTALPGQNVAIERVEVSMSYVPNSHLSSNTWKCVTN